MQIAGTQLKLEIVFEARIVLAEPGPDDRVCGVAALTPLDMAATKLLANSDRWADDAVHSRDLIDLAMMEPPKKLLAEAIGKARGAYGESADLTRYLVEGGNRVLGERMRVPIAAALSGTADADTRLRDGDVLTIGELAGWNDVGATITVKGEVAHPGAYGIREGERLSSILARAGGLRADAYAYGAIFERTQVRELEERNHADLIRRVQDDKNELKLVTDIEPDQKIAKGAALTQWQATIDRVQSIPPAGRLVIHISNDVRRWANSSSDIQVRAGDVIYIPKKPNFVMVDGAVYNPTAVSFRPGKSARAASPTWPTRKPGLSFVPMARW